MKTSPAFKRLNQALIAMHPVRFKILLALYMSEVFDESFSKKDSEAIK